MQLHLSASPRFVADGGPAHALALRDAALLAWLALEGPTPRQRLATLLWPDSDGDAARNALRQRLHQLRKQCGVALVEGSAVLSLAPGVSHDLQEADGVLGDAATGLGPEFVAWLAHQRERRKARVRQSLAELADMAERAGDHEDALSHALELLALEPLSEEAHRRLMRVHYLRGDRAAALLAFDRCEQVLKDEVGARPSPETLALLADVEAGAPDALKPLAGLPATLLRPPRPAGRDAERDALRATWDAGEGFVLVGDAGMGKSRLLEALAADWPGAMVVRARPGDAAVPLALAARLVDQLCAREPAWMQDPSVRTLRELLAAPSPVVRPLPRPPAPLLRDLLSLALAATPPLALVVDDWQFADDTSVELITDALETPHLDPLRRGHAMRPVPVEVSGPRLEALRLRSGRRVHELVPLSPEGVAEMVASLRLRGVDVPALSQALHRRVGGNPLYLLEVLRHMHERRVPLHAGQVLAPQHVKSLVTARMGELDDAARRLLRMAAVAGVDFDPELAEALSGQHLLDLSDAWSALQRLGLFDTRGIAHDLYAEAVLDQLPEPIARVLHGRVAGWLELRSGEAVRLAARVAAHWRAAADDARAVPHLLVAARQAWHAALAAESFEFCRQAAEIEAACGHGDEAFDHWFVNADAMSEIGTPALLERCVHALRALARDEGQRLRTSFVQSVYDWMLDNSEATLDALIGHLPDAIALRDVRIESECRFAAANRATRDGRFDEAVSQLAAAERLLLEAGDERRAAALAASLAMVQGLRGRTREALKAQARLLPVLRAQGDQATWTVLRASAAQQHARQGDVDAALAAAQEALDAARRASIAPPDTVVAWRYLVEVLRWTGRFTQALEVSEEFTRRLQAHGNLPRVQTVPAALYLHLGRADLALPLLQPARDAPPPPSQRDRLRLQMLEAELAAHGAVPAPAWPTDALAPGGDLALAAEWALWSGLQPASPWPAAALAEVARRCELDDFHLLTPALRALVAVRLLQEGDTAAASPWLAPATAAPRANGDHAAVAWEALYASRAWQLAGGEHEAAAHARRGMAWLQHTAEHAMPAPFRDSFLQRHPVHRALAAVAARAGT